MPNLGGWEIVLVILVIVLVFGSKRLPDASRSLGRSLRIFKAETKGLRDDDDKIADVRTHDQQAYDRVMHPPTGQPQSAYSPPGTYPQQSAYPEQNPYPPQGAAPQQNPNPAQGAAPTPAPPQALPPSPPVPGVPPAPGSVSPPDQQRQV